MNRAKQDLSSRYLIFATKLAELHMFQILNLFLT